MTIKKKVPSLKKKYAYVIDPEGGEFEHYQRDIKNSSSENPVGYPVFWDTFFRNHIGKTNDINVAMCSHDAIINREMPEHYCRICHTDLSVVGKARVNDYLVLRHPQCTKPICLKCSENNPDEFYKAFEKGVYKALIVTHGFNRTP